MAGSIKINYAKKSELLTVDGVGEALADNIITMRKLIPISADILATMTGFRTDMLSVFEFDIDSDTDVGDQTSPHRRRQSPNNFKPNRPNIQNGDRACANVCTAKQTVTVPRNLSYDGNSNWRNFWQRFLAFVNQFELTDINSIVYYFSIMLEGKASHHFENQKRRKDFFTIESLRVAMESRFGSIESSQSALLQLLEIRQFENEEVRDYEDRIWELAEKAYPSLRTEEIERHVILSFARGLQNRDAAQFIMCQNFDKMHRAMQCYVVFMESRRTIPSTRRDDKGYVVRQMYSPENVHSVPREHSEFRRDEGLVQASGYDRYHNSQYPDHESNYHSDRIHERYPDVQSSVRRVQSHTSSEIGELKKLLIDQGRTIDRQNLLIESLCSRMSRMEKSMDILVRDKLSGHKSRRMSPSPSFNRNKSPMRNRSSSQSPNRARSKSPIPYSNKSQDRYNRSESQFTCFLCHAPGHYAADCPERKVSFQKNA